MLNHGSPSKPRNSSRRLGSPKSLLNSVRNMSAAATLDTMYGRMANPRTNRRPDTTRLSANPKITASAMPRTMQPPTNTAVLASADQNSGCANSRV